MTFVLALIAVLTVSLVLVAGVPRVLARRTQLDALNVVARVPVPVSVIRRAPLRADRTARHDW